MRDQLIIIVHSLVELVNTNTKMHGEHKVKKNDKKQAVRIAEGYKYYANAPQCYCTSTLPSWFVQSEAGRKHFFRYAHFLCLAFGRCTLFFV